MTFTSTAPNTTGGRRHTISRIARRLPLVAAATLLPLVPGAAAFAADNVICVGNPAGPCNENAASISAAIIAADANNVDDTILVGAGTYNDGPYALDGSIHAVTLKGAGQDATFLTLPAAASSNVYVLSYQAAVQDLTITMAAATSKNDTGLYLVNSTAVAVRVDGAGTQNALGMNAKYSAVSMSAVQMSTDSGSYGFFSRGGTTVTDSTIIGEGAFVHSGASTDTVSRVTIKAEYTGIGTDDGTVTVDDALIDLGASQGTGLAAMNLNPNPSPKAILANHVTIVGGAAGSTGAYAYAANPNALQVSTVQLTNSVIRGPATDLVAIAGNNGAQGGPSTATISTSYSSWSTKSETAMANGTASVVVGPGNLNVDPAFANAAGGDYRLTPGSPVIDHGDPAGPGPTLDLDGKARVVDGDSNGTSIRDMGAYELSSAAAPDTAAPDTTAPDTTAPDTTITSKPAKVLTKGRVRFRVSSNEAGVTFRCKLDDRAWRPCTSPKKFRIKVGKHRFSVRATDVAGNSDATPATYRFKRLQSPS